MARTSIYLNFSGNTEEAFLFYKSVFGGEFGNDGITRFGDMPTMEGAPPMSEAVQSMILHVEIAITGGLILMGTDAPQELGFTVHQGNNVNINLEPDTKTEAERLFDALSEGGTILQPLQEMFWGAYYGHLQDKFGINWMVNCANEAIS
ncbi:MAG: VOC family protein [Bacteroidetes bacterium]|nr:VOC family protein [bacterium]NBP64987.1 VOC family protein [Bacteroidota bacterium]